MAALFFLLIGLPLGGVLSTGQAEPLRWVSVSLYFAVGLAFLLRRQARNWRWVNYGVAAALSCAAVLVFCGVAGRYWSWSHALLLGLINFVLLATMDLLFRIPRAAGLILAGTILAGLLLPARSYLWVLEAHPMPGRERLAVMTSLPIGPMRGREIAEILNEKGNADPVSAELSRHFTLHHVDFLSKASLGGERRLLLAHPRALSPSELADLDQWVRAGGRALILADPLLVWPSHRPLGDPHGPPITSLLDPLLSHWGLKLEPANSELVHKVDANGRLLATAGASRFVITGPQCLAREAGLLVHCRVGRGGALLVADADLLNPALWMGGDGTEVRDANRTADNMQLVLQWLNISEARLAPRTGWLLSREALATGLAAALLLLLPFVVFLRTRKQARPGNSWDKPGTS